MIYWGCKPPKLQKREISAWPPPKKRQGQQKAVASVWQNLGGIVATKNECQTTLIFYNIGFNLSNSFLF